MIQKLLDGWDLGILIVVNRENSINIKPVFSKISSELVSEVGWLKGGEEELKQRLTKLENLGLLKKEVSPFFGCDSTKWEVTDLARKEFEGLKFGRRCNERMKKHDFCRFNLKLTRKEFGFKKKISGLGPYYVVNGKTYEIHSCCRWSGKAKLIRTLSIKDEEVWDAK